MRVRRLVLLFATVLVLSVSLISAASAATRGQDASPDADTSAASDVQPGQAYLGLEVTNLTDRIRRLLGLPEAVSGLVVMGAHPGSPANDAGLERGDIAMSFDGHELVEAGQLRRFLNSKAPGGTIEIVYFRDGERHQARARLAEVPEQVERPEWLKKMRAFLHAFPNAVDGSVRVLDEDGEVRTFLLTAGEVVRISEDKIAVENKLGEVGVYDILDRTVFYARYHRIRPGVVEPGMQVAVLTVDGHLRAVIVTARAEGAPDADTDAEAIEAPREMRARIAADFQAYVGSLRERLENNGRMPEDVRQHLEERLSEVRAKLQDRLGRVNDRLEERREVLRERLEERGREDGSTN